MKQYPDVYLGCHRANPRHGVLVRRSLPVDRIRTAEVTGTTSLRSVPKRLYRNRTPTWAKELSTSRWLSNWGGIVVLLWFFQGIMKPLWCPIWDSYLINESVQKKIWINNQAKMAATLKKTKLNVFDWIVGALICKSCLHYLKLLANVLATLQNKGSVSQSGFNAEDDDLRDLIKCQSGKETKQNLFLIKARCVKFCAI